jgi:hypothetical protein
MAVVRTRACDRCGKTIKYGKFPYSITETHKQITILGFGPYDYLHSKYELCRECSEKYDDFMRGKEQGDEH